MIPTQVDTAKNFNKKPLLIWENDRDTLTDCRPIVAMAAEEYGFFPAFLNHEAADNAIYRFNEAKKKKSMQTQCGLILREFRPEADYVIRDFSFSNADATFEIPEYYSGKTFSLNGRAIEFPLTCNAEDYRICRILKETHRKTDASKYIFAVNEKLTPQAWLIICREAMLNNRSVPSLEIRVTNEIEYWLISEICNSCNAEVIYTVTPEIKPFGRTALHCKNFFETAVKKVLTEKRADLLSSFPEVELSEFLSGDSRYALREAAIELKDDINAEIKLALSNILSFTYCK